MSTVRPLSFAKGWFFIPIVACVLLFITRIIFGDAFTVEEASHGLYGLWIWHDITTFNLGGFFYDTSRQMVWPFLHSWLLGVFFLFFGANYIAARLLSLLLFLVTLGLLYILADKFCEKDGQKIGALAVILMLVSPLGLNFAVQNTVEILGAVLFLLATYLYLVAEVRILLFYYVLLALAIGLSLYTNYIYAFLMLPSFLVVTLVKLGPLCVEAEQLKCKGEKTAVAFVWWAYRKLITLGVFLLLAGILFSFNFSRRLSIFLDTVLRSGVGESGSWWQGLIYYPSLIIQQISFSPWLGLLIFLSLFWPLASRRYHGVKKLYIFVWTTLLLASLAIPAKAPQMIYLIVPFILLIFSALIFYCLELLTRRDSKLIWVLMAILILPALISLPRAIGLYLPATQGESMVTILDFVKENVPQDATVATGVNLAHFSPDNLKFHLRDFNDRVLGEADLNENSINNVKYFVTLELDGNSPYQTAGVDDSLARWNNLLNEKTAAGQLRLSTTHYFSRIGVTAKIYQKI
jgi:hypothetical protein